MLPFLRCLIDPLQQLLSACRARPWNNWHACFKNKLPIFQECWKQFKKNGRHLRLQGVCLDMLRECAVTKVFFGGIHKVQ